MQSSNVTLPICHVYPGEAAGEIRSGPLYSAVLKPKDMTQVFEFRYVLSLALSPLAFNVYHMTAFVSKHVIYIYIYIYVVS